MFLAHLPAGYLATTFVQKIAGDQSTAVLATGLVASVLPDMDLFWFYLVDDRQTVHHSYFTHTPVFWLGAGAIAWLILKAMRHRSAALFVGVGLMGVMLHLILDSIAAEIHWLWPHSDFELNLVVVPASHNWWVWNFIFHWTFLVEALIIVAALVVWVVKRKMRQRFS